MHVLTLAALAALSAAEQNSHWRTVPVCEADGIAVRLRVLGRASLATPDWLAVEIDNTGRPPRKVTQITFRFTKAAEELGTGKALFTGGMASGQRFDPTGTGLFTDGRYRDVRDVSDYSAALLALPGTGAGAFRAPAEGYRVRARFHIRVDYDGGTVETSRDGVPFDFEWRRPSEAGFVAVRARLRELLANPVNRVPHCYILGLLLGIPEATRGLSAADLLAALDRRAGPFDGRQEVVTRLLTAHAGDPAIVPYYRKRLAAGDRAVLDDLANSDVWDAGFVEPVFAAFTRNTDGYGSAARILDRRWERTFVPRLVELVAADAAEHGGALVLLARHRGDWRGDRQVEAALSDAVRKARPVVNTNSRDVPDDELAAWADAVNFWALTGDPAAVRTLTPALADRRRFCDPRPVRRLGLGSSPTVVHEPERACDAAMAAIWGALDGPDAAQRRLGVVVPPGAAEVANDTVRAWRDLQLVALSARLAARRALTRE